MTYTGHWRWWDPAYDSEFPGADLSVFNATNRGPLAKQYVRPAMIGVSSIGQVNSPGERRVGTWLMTRWSDEYVVAHFLDLTWQSIHLSNRQAKNAFWKHYSSVMDAWEKMFGPL